MRFSNLHAHSVFSDGVNTLRENVECAISKEMLSLGFSDHSYTACDESYCMMPRDYDRYLTEIFALKSEFCDTLPIYAGIEQDYYSDRADYGFDYIIASVHYVKAKGKYYAVDHMATIQRECISDGFGGNVMDMVRSYYASVVEHAYLTRPSVIGHFDVITKFGIVPEHSDEYLRVATEALRETARYCSVFEINTGAISRGYRTEPYPAMPLLSELRALDVKIVINSDSHAKENLDSSFDLALKCAVNAGYDSIHVFDNGVFKPVSIK